MLVLIGLAASAEMKDQGLHVNDCDIGITWHAQCKDELNKHINMELIAAFTYMSMFTYFDRTSTALPKVASFYQKMHEEEMRHAHEFIKYQNTRGGNVVLHDIAVHPFEPDNVTRDIVIAAQRAIRMECDVYQSLRTLYDLSEGVCKDPVFSDVLVKYMSDQLDSIRELRERYHQLTRASTSVGHGLWHAGEDLAIV